MVQREIETTKNKVGSNRRRSERSKAGNLAKRSGRSNLESMISRQRCAAASLSSYERYYNGKALRRGDRVSDTSEYIERREGVCEWEQKPHGGSGYGIKSGLGIWGGCRRDGGPSEDTVRSKEDSRRLRQDDDGERFGGKGGLSKP